MTDPDSSVSSPDADSWTNYGKEPVMSDAIIAAVRTAVQAGITFLGAWLLARGIVLDPAIEAALMTIAIGAVTLILNKLQERFPWLGQILSLGMSSNGPSYKG